jgi:hypothetical protein
MRTSHHVILIADDPIALKDVPAMAEARGWHCDVALDEDGTRFSLRK